VKWNCCTVVCCNCTTAPLWYVQDVCWCVFKDKILHWTWIFANAEMCFKTLHYIIQTCVSCTLASAVHAWPSVSKIITREQWVNAWLRFMLNVQPGPKTEVTMLRWHQAPPLIYIIFGRLQECSVANTLVNFT